MQWQDLSVINNTGSSLRFNGLHKKEEQKKEDNKQKRKLINKQLQWQNLPWIVKTSTYLYYKKSEKIISLFVIVFRN